jgi:hypothetical protein
VAQRIRDEQLGERISALKNINWEGEIYLELYWLVVWNETGLFFHILGISSSQLTHIFQRGSDHQPDMEHMENIDMMDMMYSEKLYIYIYSIDVTLSLDVMEQLVNIDMF